MGQVRQAVVEQAKGFISQFYAMNQDDHHYTYWPSNSVVEQRVNENRLRHLPSARDHFMVLMEQRSPHTDRVQWKKLQSRIKDAKKRFNNEKKRLETTISKLKEDCRKERTDPEEMEKRLHQAYAMETLVEENQVLVQKEPFGIRVVNEVNGLRSFDGDPFGTSRAVKTRDDFVRIVENQETTEKEESSWNDSSVLESIKDLERNRNTIHNLIVRSGGTDLCVNWKKPALVDQDEKRNRRKETVKQIRNRLARRLEPCPYMPMTAQQSLILHQLYTQKRWTRVSWRTVYSISERKTMKERLDSKYSSRHSMITTAIMRDSMSYHSVVNAVNSKEGKGMTDKEEMMAILSLSEVCGREVTA